MGRGNAHDDNAEDDDIPLHHRKPFGCGLRRKQIDFVPASTDSARDSHPQDTARATPSVADMYLNLVLPNHAATTDPDPKSQQRLCEICDLPIDGDAEAEAVGESRSSSSGADVSVLNRKHDASLAHQVRMAHSHPPSALDRSRMGLAVLRARGWDPDARRGLGAAQQGVPHPVKVKPKDDTLGVGVKVPRGLSSVKKDSTTAGSRVQKKRLDARGMRLAAVQDRKRREGLERQFYGNPDLDRYLGTG